MQAHGKPKNHDIVQASGDATFRVAKMLSLVGSQGENEERLICSIWSALRRRAPTQPWLFGSWWLWGSWWLHHSTPRPSGSAKVRRFVVAALKLKRGTREKSTPSAVHNYIRVAVDMLP